MAHARSILFECHGYRAEASHERCKAVEEHVMECIEGECRIESARMRELCVDGDVVQPTVEIVYSKGDYRSLISKIDRALLDIGLVATRALVSTVAPHMAGAAAAGAAAGGGTAGGVAARGRRSGGPGAAAAAAVLAGTLVGAAVGALAGRAAEKRVPGFIGTKQSGAWTIKRFPTSSR